MQGARSRYRKSLEDNWRTESWKFCNKGVRRIKCKEVRLCKFHVTAVIRIEVYLKAGRTR